MTSKDANIALLGIRLGASNIVVAYFKVKSNFSNFIFSYSKIFNLIQEGRSETIVNELGDRVTPTFITFNDGNDIV